MMVKTLDRTYDEDIKEGVIALLDEQQMSAGEAVSGLVAAILTLAEGNVQLLDEAIDRLVDGGN